MDKVQRALDHWRRVRRRVCPHINYRNFDCNGIPVAVLEAVETVSRAVDIVHVSYDVDSVNGVQSITFDVDVGDAIAQATYSACKAPAGVSIDPALAEIMSCRETERVAAFLQTWQTWYDQTHNEATAEMQQNERLHRVY